MKSASNTDIKKVRDIKKFTMQSCKQLLYASIPNLYDTTVWFRGFRGNENSFHCCHPTVLI